MYDVVLTDLYGANNVEASRADMINDGVEDLRVAYTRMIYQNYVGISIQYKWFFLYVIIFPEILIRMVDLYVSQFNTNIIYIYGHFPEYILNKSVCYVKFLCLCISFII